MANKSVFASTVGKLLPRPDSRNREGAPAYAYEPRHELAQLAVTGCLNGTFYAEAREQLAAVTALCRREVRAAEQQAVIQDCILYKIVSPRLS